MSFRMRNNTQFYVQPKKLETVPKTVPDTVPETVPSTQKTIPTQFTINKTTVVYDKSSGLWKIK